MRARQQIENVDSFYKREYHHNIHNGSMAIIRYKYNNKFIYNIYKVLNIIIRSKWTKNKLDVERQQFCLYLD